jgi:hypothetical protein
MARSVAAANRPCTTVLRLVVTAIAIIGLSAEVAIGKAGGTSNSRVVAGARFGHLPPRWRYFGDEPVLLSHAGAHSNAFVTSWKFRPQTPGGWLGNLPRDAAGLSVLLVRRSTSTTRPSCGYPVSVSRYPLLGRTPIRLRDLARGPSDDNPRTLDLSLKANVSHLYTMDLRVEFGSTTPARWLKRLVDLALASLELPRWPMGC